jgi:hypothetical protein
MMGVAIRDMISPLFYWSGAAAAGMILIVLTLIVLVFSAWLVRRQSFWHQWRLKLRESLAHLVGLIMWLGCCDVSVALRVSFV